VGTDDSVLLCVCLCRQERLNQRDKEMQKMALLIKQEEDKPENIKSQLSSEDSGVITRRLRVSAQRVPSHTDCTADLSYVIS